jgi:predicted MPP superfamily phosphohydrolase
MASAACSDEEFVKLFRELGSPQAIAETLGVSVRNVFARRNRLAQKHGIELISFSKHSRITNVTHEQKIYSELKNGIVVVFSDAHYWPGPPTVAHQALLAVVSNLKPAIVIANGDVFDGARVSRHDPIYKHETPSAKEEVEACVARMTEIEDASKNSVLIWNVGNHDQRLWRYIRVNAPEVSGMANTDLFDYFGRWKQTYAVDINGSTLIKHRWHNGIHATYNNALRAMGAHVVTGHLHRLQITAVKGYGHQRFYGVDTGTLADVDGRQFAYLEHNPVMWASGFAVLTFRNGVLLPPELVEVIDGEAFFRSCKIA